MSGADVASEIERRVAGGPLRSCSLVNTPEATTSSAHRRAALANDRRQVSAQNFCARPPFWRRSNTEPHHRQVQAASVFEAEAAAQSFTALHRIAWQTVEVLYR